MNRKLIILIAIVTIGLVGIFSFLSKSKTNQVSEKAILFYGIGCPHCSKVEEFIKENKIKEKISFEEKEVYFNRENARLLVKKAKECGFKENAIGVPFLWDGKNCIVGEEPIISFFREKLENL